jgi:type VI secretion system protein
VELTLKVIRFNNRPSERPMSHTWTERSGTVGRNAGNDWVLPDTQRFLSGQHAAVEYREGEYFIRDTSTNGVFINQSKTPLGKNNVLALHEGDQIRMGLYELEAGFAYAAGVAAPVAPAIAPDWGGGDWEKDPFDFLQPGGADRPDKEAQRGQPIPFNVADNAFYIPDIVAPEPLAAEDKKAAPQGGDASALPANWWEAPSDKPVEEAPAPPVKPRPPPPAAVPLPTLDNPTVDNNDALRLFLQGAGIQDTGKQTAIQGTQDLESLGRLFRIAIQGTLDALHARAEIKSAMRMDVTTIQRIGNNPLKFSVTADDALNRLLSPRSEAYLPPEQALLEAFDDIRAHQLAVIAGVQAALTQVLKRFDPALLVQRLEKHNPVSANIPIQRQAKLWDLFEELYTTLEQECQDDFQRLFGLEFAEAYDAQIAKLKGGQEHG